VDADGAALVLRGGRALYRYVGELGWLWGSVGCLLEAWACLQMCVFDTADWRMASELGTVCAPGWAVHFNGDKTWPAKMCGCRRAVQLSQAPMPAQRIGRLHVLRTHEESCSRECRAAVQAVWW